MFNIHALHYKCWTFSSIEHFQVLFCAVEKIMSLKRKMKLYNLRLPWTSRILLNFSTRNIRVKLKRTRFFRFFPKKCRRKAESLSFTLCNWAKCSEGLHGHVFWTFFLFLMMYIYGWGVWSSATFVLYNTARISQILARYGDSLHRNASYDGYVACFSRTRYYFSI